MLARQTGLTRSQVRTDRQILVVVNDIPFYLFIFSDYIFVEA